MPTANDGQDYEHEHHVHVRRMDVRLVFLSMRSGLIRYKLYKSDDANSSLDPCDCPALSPPISSSHLISYRLAHTHTDRQTHKVHERVL